MLPFFAKDGRLPDKWKTSHPADYPFITPYSPLEVNHNLAICSRCRARPIASEE
jgi:hypothetical protein